MSTTHDPQVETPVSARLRAVSFEGHTPPDDYSPGRYYPAYTTGGLSREGVGAQAAQHYLMYEAIEGAAEHLRDRLGDDFHFWIPQLHRLPSIEDDLRFWWGDGWRDRIAATPGIREYVDRIRAVAFDSVPLYVAHQYTRYLADLSGGQAIGRLVREAYGLGDGPGARFYEFREIEDPIAFKADYRLLLDLEGFSEDDIVRMESEVREAYRLNNLAFADLEARFEEYAE